MSILQRIVLANPERVINTGHSVVVGLCNRKVMLDDRRLRYADSGGAMR